MQNGKNKNIKEKEKKKRTCNQKIKIVRRNIITEKNTTVTELEKEIAYFNQRSHLSPWLGATCGQQCRSQVRLAEQPLFQFFVPRLKTAQHESPGQSNGLQRRLRHNKKSVA